MRIFSILNVNSEFIIVFSFYNSVVKSFEKKRNTETHYLSIRKIH